MAEKIFNKHTNKKKIFFNQVLTLEIKKAPKLTSPDCTFSSCLPSDVGGRRQGLGVAEQDAWDVEGGAVEKGGGASGPQPGSVAGTCGGSGTEGRTPGKQ